MIRSSFDASTFKTINNALSSSNNESRQLRLIGNVDCSKSSEIILSSSARANSVSPISSSAEETPELIVFARAGNFLVSRCLEAGDATIAQLYSANLCGHFLELSLDPFGCHVVQKLLDCSDKATKERVIDEFVPLPSRSSPPDSADIRFVVTTDSHLSPTRS